MPESNVTRAGATSAGALLLRKIATTVMLFAATATVGCALLPGGSKYVIPEEQTPREQAAIAERQAMVARQTIDEDAKKEEVGKAVAALRKVVTKFPKDREYTPAAHVESGRFQAELGDHKNAIKTYRAVIASYPDIEDVHALALLGLGESFDAVENYVESKKAYRQLIDTHGQSQDPLVRDCVVKARSRYRIIQ